MDVFEAIKTRHSYRGEFADVSVKNEDLKKIVQAGIQAPSGKNAQTTEFVIVDEVQKLLQIGQMHSMAAVKQTKAIVLCIVDKQPEALYEGYSFNIEDCAAATENMLLAITALGYASVWIDGWLRLENRAQKIAQIIDLPENKQIKILLPIGVPKEELHQKEKKDFSERACFNKYAL